MKHIKQFPHCDPRILHEPGECDVCDLHPDWQELRKYWQICFTGHTPVPLDVPDSWRTNGPVLPCPADYLRGDTHTKWYGNVAHTKNSTNQGNEESL